MKGGSRYISLGVAKKTNRQVKGQRLTASSNGAVFPPAEQQQPCRAFRSVFLLSKHQIETRFNCKFELGRFREAAPLPSYFSFPPPLPLTPHVCCSLLGRVVVPHALSIVSAQGGIVGGRASSGDYALRGAAAQPSGLETQSYSRSSRSSPSNRRSVSRPLADGP